MGVAVGFFYNQNNQTAFQQPGYLNFVIVSGLS